MLSDFMYSSTMMPNSTSDDNGWSNKEISCL